MELDKFKPHQLNDYIAHMALCGELDKSRTYIMDKNVDIKDYILYRAKDDSFFLHNKKDVALCKSFENWEKCCIGLNDFYAKEITGVN